jgi:hypothetical protein
MHLNELDGHPLYRFVTTETQNWSTSITVRVTGWCSVLSLLQGDGFCILHYPMQKAVKDVIVVLRSSNREPFN